MRKLTYQNIGRETKQFYGKLPSNRSIGRETIQFYTKLTSNQSIGRETTQFLWEIDLPKYWKGNYAV